MVFLVFFVLLLSWMEPKQIKAGGGGDEEKKKQVVDD